jgi:hypothetical protein
LYKSIQQGTIQTNNQKGPILTREQYNIHKQEGTVYNPVMLPSEFGFLYCFLLIVSVVLFLLVVGFVMFLCDCGFYTKGPILTREQYNIHKQEGTV